MRKFLYVVRLQCCLYFLCIQVCASNQTKGFFYSPHRKLACFACVRLLSYTMLLVNVFIITP